ncbi:integrase arm-type DNA-binding domain-containing protein [Teichococcus aestuarii]
MAQLVRGQPIPIKPGRYSAGSNLWLQVRGPHNMSWLMRYSFNGQPRELGLGTFAMVSWEEAESEVKRWREVLRQGRDPKADRDDARRATEKLRARSRTFAEVAQMYIDENIPGWRNKKSPAQWKSGLKKYAFPLIGRVPISVPV